MVTVQLFSSSKVDNAGRMGNFASAEAQDSYFEALTKSTIIGARLNNLGDPLEIQRPWTDVLGYGYGRFQVSDKWIYFSVRDIAPINDTKTRILYNIDCWETCRHQYAVTLGRGIVTRSQRALSTRNVRPFTPIYTRTQRVQRFSLASPLGIAFVRDSETNENWVYVASDRSAGVGPYIDGSWLTMLGISNLNDVYGAWLSPFPISTSEWTPINDQGIIGYKKKATEITDVETTYFTVIDTAPYMDQDDCYGFTDMRGNLVWSSDLSDDTDGTTLYCQLNISPSTCNWRCYVGKNVDDNIPEKTFTIPCEPIYFYSDAFAEYNARQRSFDMEQRSINRDSQLVGGLTSISSGIIGGAVTGAIAGPVGAVAGAVLGAVGSVVGSVASYAIQPSFDDRTQRATDAYYNRQADALVLTGDGLLNILYGRTGCELVNVETDPATQSQYADAVSTGGNFYQSLEVEDMEDWVVNGPLTASVEVLGPIPDNWKSQIQSRIAQGVIFV